MKKNQKFLRQESIALFQNTETKKDIIQTRNCNTYKQDERNPMMPNLYSKIQSFDKRGDGKINSKSGKASGMIFPIILKHTGFIYFLGPSKSIT